MATPTPSDLSGAAGKLASLIVLEGADFCFVPVSELRLPFAVAPEACALIGDIVMRHWHETSSGYNWHITYEPVTQTFVAISRRYIAGVNSLRG